MTNRGRQLLEDENVLTITCHCSPLWHWSRWTRRWLTSPDQEWTYPRWESGGLKVGRCGYIIMKYTTFVKPSGWWRSPFPLDGYSLWLYPSHDVDSEGYLINLVKTPLWDCVTLSEQAMWAHIIICLIWLNISRQCHPSGAQLLLNGIMAGPRVLLWIEIDSDVQVWKQFSWDISSNL